MEDERGWLWVPPPTLMTDDGAAAESGQLWYGSAGLSSALLSAWRRRRVRCARVEQVCADQRAQGVKDAPVSRKHIPLRYSRAS